MPLNPEHGVEEGGNQQKARNKKEFQFLLRHHIPISAWNFSTELFHIFVFSVFLNRVQH